MVSTDQERQQKVKRHGTRNPGWKGTEGELWCHVVAIRYACVTKPPPAFAAYAAASPWGVHGGSYAAYKGKLRKTIVLMPSLSVWQPVFGVTEKVTKRLKVGDSSRVGSHKSAYKNREKCEEEV